MMLDIAPCENPWYNCLDVLILTLARYWKIEHRMMFADAWRFRYTKAPATAESVSFEDALDVIELVEKRDIENALYQYHGLRVTHHPVRELNDVLAIVKKELAQETPVALGVDAYHCHWSAAYHKYHLHHYCLGIGIDEDKCMLFVLDPYLTPRTLEFPFDEYAETLSEIICFERSGFVPPPPDWEQLLCRRALEMQDGFQEMRDLADDLEKYLDFFQEVVRHEDPYASKLVLYFKTLSFSRVNYADCLACLGEVSANPKLLEAADRMRALGNELFTIFLLLMKSSLTPQRFKVGNIADKLRNVADREEDLAKEFLQLPAAAQMVQ
jgi:hypothetical protein